MGVAWGFRITCPDCRCEWEGIEVTFRIGPWPVLEPSNTQSRFCPRCYYRLFLPRVIDRAAWRLWYKKFLASDEAQVTFVRQIAVQLGVINCPGCSLPMADGCACGDHLICPRCGSLSAVRTGYERHVSLADGGGWA